jgi:transcriptional regulator with XRE-family HTH domain
VQTSEAPRQIQLPPLRAVREAHGLGLREVATQAQIDPAHLSRVERGERALSLESRVLGLRELERMLKPYARGDR